MTETTEPTTDVAKVEPGPASLGVTDAASWNALLAQADMVANTKIVPAMYQGDRDSIIAAALTGAEFGWPVMTSLRYIFVIDGKPSFSAEAVLGMVRQHGHSVVGTADRFSATITGKRRDSHDEITVTYDLHDALAAGLIDSINDDGTAHARNRGGKSVWEKHTQHMLWARAATTLCRRLFPEVTLGAGFVPEEFEGPEWVDPTPGPATAAATTGEVTETPADVRTADIIRERYELLPVEAKMVIDDWLGKSKAPPMDQISGHDHPEFLAQVAGVVDKAISKYKVEPFGVVSVEVEEVPAEEVQVLPPSVPEPTRSGIPKSGPVEDEVEAEVERGSALVDQAEVERIAKIEEGITVQVAAAKAKQAARRAADKVDDAAIKAEFEAGFE